MSHDIEASYAATEVVNQILINPTNFFDTAPSQNLSAYAAREGRHSWPFADGVVELVDGTQKYSIAIEFKRPNEGVHGILTAIGQSHAYLRKGYAGSLIVVPQSYSNLSDIGDYIKGVLDYTSPSQAIGVFSYSKPNLTKPSPFAGCLNFHRQIKIDRTISPPSAVPLSHSETQWAHVREGSSDPDAFLKYLQCIKFLGGGVEKPNKPYIPDVFKESISRISRNQDPEIYLSNCPGMSLADHAWRLFWFKYVLHPEAIEGWSKDNGGFYSANTFSSLIDRSDGQGKKLFFVGRSDSIKTKLVKSLNQGDLAEEQAYDLLIENTRKSAHSYREDIDSGCEHLGFVDAEGRLTDSGYKFVDSCERFGSANSGHARSIFSYAVLAEGGLGAFLHYIYRLSDERFKSDPLAFSNQIGNRIHFDQSSYLSWLEEELVNNLHVMHKVSLRGGTARKPFQAELAILRQLNIVGNFRVGVGMEINWPEFQKILSEHA